MSANGSIRNSLVTKLLLSVGFVLLVSLSLWGYVYVDNVKEKSMGNLTGNLDRLSNTIRLGLHYAMMLNSREWYLSVCPYRTQCLP